MKKTTYYIQDDQKVYLFASTNLTEIATKASALLLKEINTSDLESAFEMLLEHSISLTGADQLTTITIKMKRE